MKAKILKPIEVECKSFRMFLGDIAEWWEEEGFEFGDKTYTSLDEFKKDYPGLVMTQPPYYNSDPKEGRDTIVLNIDIETGIVMNWPKNVIHAFHDKIVDTGKYEVLDDIGNIIVEYTGYVPDFIGEYGDYLNFDVDENGKVYLWCGKTEVPWKFDQREFDQIKEGE